MRLETAEEEEEVRSVLKVIAASGKFWYVFFCKLSTWFLCTGGWVSLCFFFIENHYVSVIMLSCTAGTIGRN